MKRTLWLRGETKPFEERVPLTPAQAKLLIEDGHNVVVEEDPNRVFNIMEYQEVGCEVVPYQSWIESAPLDATILGLKELEEKEFTFKRRHIHFAHLFKGQNGCQKMLKRFKDGGGLLYDLEYLTDENSTRIAAFGVWAGFTGAALGLDLWLCQKSGINMNNRERLTSYPSSEALVAEMKEKLEGNKPKVLIIGSKGRCGQGALKFFNDLGIEATGWGREETVGKTHIKEILDYDILVNCVLMTQPLGPWITPEMIDGNQRLSVLSDVSCDPTGPCNPMPVYPAATTMSEPAYYYPEDKNFAVTSIDHLPSLLPRES
ncbi:MAG: saccharopine dehydrogenase, partial [Halobacteriovoraceae bacterium]|nr:saccharopine dehydrogenase [Halobacteriovoraceae bacterium]